MVMLPCTMSLIMILLMNLPAEVMAFEQHKVGIKCFFASHPCSLFADSNTLLCAVARYVQLANRHIH